MHINKIEISARIISVKETAKSYIYRVMFRNGISQTRFIDVMCLKDFIFNKNDEVLITGKINIMEKTEKFPYEKTYIYADNIVAYNNTKTEKSTTVSNEGEQEPF